MQNKSNTRDEARQAGFYKWRDRIQSPSETNKRFWGKVTVLGPDDCWLWNGSINEHGYGSLTHKARRWKAHRFAFFLTHGEFDLSMDVMHECDTPPCCNPKHLKLGTHDDNMHAMSVRGRWGTKPRVFGEAHGMSKLTACDVTKIRFLYSRGATKRELGVQFNVTAENIFRVVNRISWRHI